MAPSNVCFWEVQASVWTELFFQIFYIPSSFDFFVFNLNCLFHSQWELWRRKKFVTVHLNPRSVWNLYIISLYFQNVHLKKEAMHVLTPSETVEAKDLDWDHKANLWQRSQDITQGSWLHQASYASLVSSQDFSGWPQTSTVPISSGVRTSPEQPGGSGFTECGASSRKPVLKNKAKPELEPGRWISASLPTCLSYLCWVAG